ncbi:MAG: DegT/DnrJ/EryC1/StrS family aminotransferase [Clostridia bacterium]|nr:DegT/DnrJ/EryC1/StrS family aminotransferase [Clostridia bacterium]
MGKLAINGGKKLIGDKRVGRPLVADETYPLINKMLKNDEISLSEVCYQLEREFADYVGVKYALCYPNGTTTIQAALYAAGVGAGDEVIVPSFTFWATVGPIVVNNAIPIFADVSLSGQNLTAETIEPLITEKTKAILLVHVWGVPCEMDKITALAKKHGIKIVTDCAHAHGASYGGKKKGIIGDVGAFSLQAFKTMPGGEGGILVTDDQEIYERAVTLGHYDRIVHLSDIYGYRNLMLTGAGYKHRIHPMSAAIALGNLHRLDELNKIRNDNARRLESYIKDLGYTEFQTVPEKAERVYSYHYMRFLSENLGNVSISAFLKALAAEGVECGSCGYGRLHKEPLYTGENSPFGKLGPFKNPYWKDFNPPKSLPNTEILNSTDFMCAPRFEYENEEYVESYAEAYKKLKDNVDELIKYDKDHPDNIIKNNGRSINRVK